MAMNIKDIYAVPMNMSPRERVLAAICHELPDRIPTDAIHVENAPEIARWLAIAESDVLDRLGIDGRIISAPFTGATRQEAGARYNEWGAPDTGDYGTARPYPLADVSSVHEIERYAWPSAGDYNFDAAGAAARQLGKTYAVRGPYWKPLFCQVCDLVGMENAMMQMAAEPVLFEAMLEHVFAHTAAFCERLLDACGDAMPILCLGDDFATQRGLMISPAAWRRYLKPRLAKLFDIGKRRGKFVWFHSCGDVTAVLPDLIDIGADVWETVQLHTLPISARDLKREYGRHLTFFGGVNTQRLPFVTPDEVREETLRCIEALGAGGGYICGPDHHIKPDVPAANAVALFDAARGFRREGYTRTNRENE
jgi:uroporphyrinogen decarboxylase